MKLKIFMQGINILPPVERVFNVSTKNKLLKREKVVNFEYQWPG
jgi:hypothetical protein